MNLENINIKKDVQIVFMGTPEFSVPVLNGLIENYKVRAIVTQPDKLIGRKQILTPTPIKEVGIKNTILVLQPVHIKDAIDEIVNLHPDLIVTCAYGQILPKEILNCSKYGCINVHASLLPKLRGGAPIHRAIIEGHKETGITIMHMSPRMDEGDIIKQITVPITDVDTASTLHNKLSIAGRSLLLDTLPSILDNTATRTPQDNAIATYGFNITREDEKIDFDKSKREIYNQIRGLNSFPGAFAMLDSKIMKIWESRTTYESYPELLNGTISRLYDDGIGVKVSNGEVVFTSIQPEGKNKMAASEYLNGLQNREQLIGNIFE